jgi:DNA mismatch repair ATPase MutS
MDKNIKMHHHNNAYNDLNIEHSIFPLIDQTITRSGSRKLLNRLRYCQSDVESLEKMTNRNYIIGMDVEYRKTMDGHLHDIARLENTVKHWVDGQCDSRMLFSWDIFNNRLFLTISNKFKVTSIMVLIFFYVFIYLYLYSHGATDSPINYTKQMAYGYYHFSKLMTRMVISSKYWLEKIAVSLTVLYIGYQLYMVYQTVNICYDHYCVADDFYQNYSKIRLYVDVVEKMHSIDDYFKNDQIRESIDYLKTYFDENSSLGYSLVCKMDVRQYIGHIDRIANYVGRVDMTLNIVRLTDPQITRPTFTIPTFIRSDFPAINMKNIWNPVLSDKSIPNTIATDLSCPNVLVITGANKSGKSTFMRSVLTNIYLSQSLGISCSEQTELTPFRDILSYINIPDCLGRESLFEAEINRCHDYIDRIERFQGFSIGIIDELFTGTNPKEGMAGSYAVLRGISSNPMNITILSTHFHDMLQHFTNDLISFYRFTADRKNGSYKFNYQIQRGISEQCIAVELLKEKGFDQDIIDDANKYLANLA